MIKKELIIVLMIVLVSSFAVADISLSEPNEVYNLGDKVYITASGLKGSTSGNLNIDLVCGNDTINLVRIPSIAFSSEEEQSYSVPYKVLNEEDLEISNMNDVLGICQISASIGAQGTSTRSFRVSDDITVFANVNKTSYDPEEEIIVYIEAVKENGELLTGFVEVTNASTFSKTIENGFVSHSFSMPKTIEAGSYFLTIFAFDKNNDKIVNSGETKVYFEINQVASSVILSLSELQVNPGSNLTFGAEVFDQSGKSMDGTVFVRTISPRNEEMSLNVASKDFASFDFPSNATAGTWEIVAEFEGIMDKKEFQIMGIQKAEFEFEGSVLSIKNIGNTVYNKTITIRIGDERRILEGLNIEIGEIRKFNLRAPDGKYPVLVEDGENEINSDLFLTGNAISVDNLKDNFVNYWILWIFLIVLLAVTGVIFFVRFKRTKTVGESKFREKMNVSPLNPDNFSKGSDVPKAERKMIDLTKGNVRGAESSLVLTGEKNISSVVSISVKNYSSLNDNSKESLKSIVDDAGKGKGLVDWKDEFIFIIFSPLITKTFNNEMLATNAGFRILNAIRDHNKKFNNKMIFNVGVHSGELVATKEDGKLKYTSLGNTITLLKKISNLSQDKLLVSESIRKKLLRDLKVVRFGELGSNVVYEVSEIKNREINEAKLKDLLKRM